VARIVLVADDSPTIQKRALGILKGEGFEVETVSNGVAAIKRLAVLHPVVILADVSMPGRDGYEVCEFVKNSAELSHVPVLLVASDMEPYDDARGAEVRADGIIKKPFEAQELISIVVRFAEQFEAAMSPAAAPVVPSGTREPTKEFAFSMEDLDEAPTVVQPGTPDISAASEGVPFAAPVEASSEHAIESEPVEMEVSYPAPSVEDLDDSPTVVHHVTPDSTAAPEEVTSAAPAVDAPPIHSTEPPPVELEAPYPEPQPEAEVVSDLPDGPDFVDTISAPEPPIAPAAEIPGVMEEPPAPSSLEPPAPVPPAQAPAFFEGLEEATTPEPVFIEEPPEPATEPAQSADEFHTVIFRAPLDIAEPVWSDETVEAPPAPEPAGPTDLEPQLEAEAPAASPEIPAGEPPAPSYIAPFAGATSLDSFSLEDATAGQVHFAPEAVEVATAGVAPEVAAPEEMVLEEVASLESAPAGATPGEVVPEETASEEVPLAEIASVEVTPLEVAAVEVAYSTPAEEVPATGIAPPESAPEAASAEIASQEAAPEEAPLEPSPEVVAPLPAFDWGLIYSVVHKVVMKMAPPALPMEVVEDLARRLAEDIVTEIVNESSQPPA